MERENWGSRLGFIVSTLGFAIGLGAIWRFPYMVGSYGGGAFLLVYLILTFIIGLPLFISEVSFGRKSKKSPILGMRALTQKKGSIWNLIGWLGLITAVVIAAYYAVIIGWVLAYIVKLFSGTFTGVSAAGTSAIFGKFVADSPQVMLYTLAIWIILYLIISRGVQKGVEKACKILLPLLLLILVVLAVYCVRLPGAGEGIKWFLTPDFSAINASVLSAALSQVFYAAGIGMAAAFAYGSYLDEKSNLTGDLSVIVLANIVVSLLVGFIIFPALFSYGLEPTAGAGMLFVTMPNVFGEMVMGNIIGGVFFFLVIIAAITSIMGLVEAVGAAFSEHLNMSRKKGVLLCTVVMALLSVPVILSFGPWADITLFGKGFFDLFDYVTAFITMPLGALLISLYVAFVWKFSNFKDYINIGAKTFLIHDWMKPLVVVVVPAAVLIVFIGGLIP